MKPKSSLARLAKEVVGDDAHHICLCDHITNFADLKVSTLLTKLTCSDDADQAVVSKEADGILHEILNYAVHDRNTQDVSRGAMTKPHSWDHLKKNLGIHVTHILLMVEDLGPFGFPCKHAFLLLRFSDGHIDRCDLMPKKQAAHAELRSFLPGLDVPGKVRYNPWRNDERAKKSYVVDIYTFVKAQPSLLSVELMKLKLQEHEYKMFNLESNNCQDFVHSVIALLAKVSEDDNVQFNQNSLSRLESFGLRCRNRKSRRSCWLCCNRSKDC